MPTIPLENLIPVKLALYGPDGLYPEILYREARQRIGPIIRRRSRYSGMRIEYFLIFDVERARRSLE